MKEKPQHKFNQIFFENRWKQRRFQRSGTWVVFGFQVWWAGPSDYCYNICLFGLRLSIWYKIIWPESYK